MAADVHSERETTDSASADAELNGRPAGEEPESAATVNGVVPAAAEPVDGISPDHGAAATAGPKDGATAEGSTGPSERPGAEAPSAEAGVEASEAAAEPAEAAPARPRRIVALLIVAALALLIDVISKMLVVAHLSDRDPIRLPGGFLRLTLVRNSGAAFSIGESQTWVFTIIAAAVVVVILRISRNLRSLAWACALGLLLGGALGNLGDRIFRSPGMFRGHVVDFLQFPRFPVVDYDFPVFNLADSAIVVGGCLMVLLSFLGRQPDGTRHSKNADQAG